jgi:dGTPase
MSDQTRSAASSTQQRLAHLRFDESLSRGRRYPESEHRYRGPFERDRARIIHSRAFRRLEGKTQVFSPRRSDHFRNRLTHTLEASQISRTVARVLGLNADFAETLALAHDIGHPPFGHAGEHELNRQMKRFGELFDHNLHALRIVETFEQRYPLFRGLNLTYEMREGLVKHSRDWTEQPLLIAEYLPTHKPPLEAQLIDLTDEIAYNSADLEDAFQAGILTLDDLMEASPVLAETLDTLLHQYPASSDWALVQAAVRQLVELLTTGLIEGTVAKAENCCSLADVTHASSRLAAFSPATDEIARQLKQFLRLKVYESADVLTGREESVQRVGQLFEFLLENPDQLPQEADDQPPRPLYRAVCDYLAGMTDAYFLKIYTKLLR